MIKKIIIIVIAIFVLILVGCTSFKEDKNHADVTIVTSAGDAYLFQSCNGSNSTHSGRDIALANQSKLSLKQGETATITFKCSACGKEESYKIEEPWAGVISCDCPEKIDSEGNAKEYVAISISYQQE